jgi:putative N-acetylmannosamine-6-phosphate epimerase
MFCEIKGERIPLVSVGTSPFLGAAQFGQNAKMYRKKFLNDASAMLEVLRAAYKAGARGIELIPIGKISEAANSMKDSYDDFIITGSTAPGPDPMIDELLELDAKIIFAHGMVSDKRDNALLSMLDDIEARGSIPGVAAHNPVSTLNYVFENVPNVKTFLIPFNASGLFMENQHKLEEIIDSRNDLAIMGMKTVAAGKISPEKAYKYISNHNIRCVTIGMVSAEEARESTEWAIRTLLK